MMDLRVLLVPRVIKWIDIRFSGYESTVEEFLL